MSRYAIMAKSSVIDIDGNNFPDPLSLRIDKFVDLSPPIQYNLDYTSVNNFDVTYCKFYKSDKNQWGDLILTLNRVSHLDSIDLTQEDSSPFILFPISNSVVNFVTQRVSVVGQNVLT